MRLIVVVFLGLASLAYAPEARACSCMQLTPSEGLTSSYAVFTGEVIEIEKNTATRFGGLEVTIRVKQMWKGDPSEELKVHTAGSSAACGYSFMEGETYLIYAIRDDADPLRVSLCSRTAPIEQAKEDLDFLGKPSVSYETKKRRRDCGVATGDAGAGTLSSFALLLGLATLGIRRFT